jgi:hypothetical protein
MGLKQGVIENTSGEHIEKLRNILKPDGNPLGT